jgi:short-subunit dehydrogenase
MSDFFQGQVAVITGAASGIGAALARALVQRQCHVALVDRQADALQALALALADKGVRISVHAMDVRDSQALADLPAQVIQAHGAVQLLINNAGVASIGPFAQQSADEFDTVWAINFGAAVGLTRAFLPHLLAQTSAQVVNMSSVFGLVAPEGQAAYAASKFALRGFSEALRQELRGSSVRIMVVHPGGVDTAIASSAMASGVSVQEATHERKRFARLPKLSATQVAECILQALPKGRDRLVLGWDARLLDVMQRCFPQGHTRVLAWLMRWGDTPRHRSNGSPGAQQQPGDGHG